jgi:2-C-methyl-D-erythritol 4-phosphate cytidylyltransferase
MTLWCVVPAAGRGLRVGGSIPKQYLPLNDRTVMQCTLDRLSVLATAAIIVPIAAHDARAGVLDYCDAARLRFVVGGTERADSVLAGLEAIAPQAADSDWVLVHDVARPCVRIDDIERLLVAIAHHPVGGLLANRVRDTMKRSVSHNAGVASVDEVAETVVRENLWHALTPQIFRYGLLRRALLSAKAQGVQVTDEAQAVELLGEKPLLMEGARDNLKITWPDDLPMADAFLKLQAASAK